MQVYPSDVSDSEWEIIAPYLRNSLGRKRTVDIRQVFNGILYLVKTGCQWRYLPKGYPNHNTVFYHFNAWKHGGVFEKLQLDVASLVRKKKVVPKGQPLAS